MLIAVAPVGLVGFWVKNFFLWFQRRFGVAVDFASTSDTRFFFFSAEWLQKVQFQDANTTVSECAADVPFFKFIQCNWSIWNAQLLTIDSHPKRPFFLWESELRRLINAIDFVDDIDWKLSLCVVLLNERYKLAGAWWSQSSDILRGDFQLATQTWSEDTDKPAQRERERERATGEGSWISLITTDVNQILKQNLDSETAGRDLALDNMACFS